jgi:hypothetical protein
VQTKTAPPLHHEPEHTFKPFTTSKYHKSTMALLPLRSLHHHLVPAISQVTNQFTITTISHTLFQKLNPAATSILILILQQLPLCHQSTCFNQAAPYLCHSTELDLFNLASFSLPI